MDEILKALEEIRYELQVANWQRGGGKGEKPIPPGMHEVTIRGERVLVKRPAGSRTFSGEVVHTTT